MKKKELGNLSEKEKQEQLKELRMELMKANAQVASGSAPKNPGQIRELKKSIARILTLNTSQEEINKDGRN
jgi:large subunit ribosomal protein L29